MFKIRKKFFWNIYLLLLSYMAYYSIASLTSPSSARFQYFYFLVHFDRIYWFPFIFNLTAALLNALWLIPLAGYIYKTRIGTQQFWQLFILIKIIFDLIGHDFYIIDLISLYHIEPYLAALSVVQILVLYSPACWAIGRYAFIPEKSADK